MKENVVKEREECEVPQYIGADGRLKAKLIDKDGVEHEEDVATLVALSFVPNPNNYTKVEHIDGDVTNNCANNLRWVE